MNGENWEKVILNKCELPRLFTNTIGPLVKTHLKFQSTSLVFASLHKIINFLLSIRITKASRLNKFCCFISLFRRSFTHRHSFKICNLTYLLALFLTQKLQVFCVHAVWNDLHELLFKRSDSIVVCFISFCLQRTYGFNVCVSWTCFAIYCLWWVLYLLKFNISEKSRSAKIIRHFLCGKWAAKSWTYK